MKLTFAMICARAMAHESEAKLRQTLKALCNLPVGEN